MTGGQGPFRIVGETKSGCVEGPISPPPRRYYCPNYNICLNLAAALNWENFYCRGCSGEIDSALLWRAKSAAKKDRIVSLICKLPGIETHTSDLPEQPLLRLVKEAK